MQRLTGLYFAQDLFVALDQPDSSPKNENASRDVSSASSADPVSASAERMSIQSEISHSPRGPEKDKHARHIPCDKVKNPPQEFNAEAGTLTNPRYTVYTAVFK